MNAKIKQYMNEISRQYIDPRTGEVNATLLAEDTAIAFGHPEWLDDEGIEVWEVAVALAEKLEGEES